jgi:diguanylate cyclase (GGDEF)-like protein
MDEHELLRFGMIHEIGQMFTSDQNIESLLPKIVKAINDLLGCEETTLYLYADAEKALYARATMTGTSDLAKLISEKGSDSVIRAVYKTGETINLTASKIKLATGLIAKGLLAVPVVAMGKTMGVLTALNWKAPIEFSEDDAQFLSIIAAFAGIAIQNAEHLRKYETLANTDALTGLLNRRAFDAALEREIARAKRYRGSVGLIMVDVDGFKMYNDRLGHVSGDKRLKEIGQLLLNSTRQSDSVGRVGGDEFALILIESDPAAMVKIVARIREQAVFVSPMNSPAGIPVQGYSLSMGLAFLDTDIHSAADLYLKADNHLMEAKRSGGNTIYPKMIVLDDILAVH